MTEICIRANVVSMTKKDIPFCIALISYGALVCFLCRLEDWRKALFGLLTLASLTTMMVLWLWLKK